MKSVSLIFAAIISISATAQTTGNAAEKKTVVKTQQKTKSGKAKSSRTKVPAAKNSGVITMTDERTYKAKWTFEEMLRRRLEIDAEEGERKAIKE